MFTFADLVVGDSLAAGGEVETGGVETEADPVGETGSDSEIGSTWGAVDTSIFSCELEGGVLCLCCRLVTRRYPKTGILVYLASACGIIGLQSINKFINKFIFSSCSIEASLFQFISQFSNL